MHQTSTWRKDTHKLRNNKTLILHCISISGCTIILIYNTNRRCGKKRFQKVQIPWRNNINAKAVRLETGYKGNAEIRSRRDRWSNGPGDDSVLHFSIARQKNHRFRQAISKLIWRVCGKEMERWRRYSIKVLKQCPRLIAVNIVLFTHMTYPFDSVNTSIDNFSVWFFVEPLAVVSFV